MTFYQGWPVCISNCADCGAGTNQIHENYMVRPDVWEQAWAGRRKPWHGKIPGQEILCIGCLERRIGRTLMRRDFTDAPINDPDDPDISDRLRSRLSTDTGTVKGGANGLISFMVERWVQKLPEHERAKARAAWTESEGRS